MENFFFFRDTQGALVADLTPGSLSEGTLLPGDLIHKIDTVEIENFADLRNELAVRKSGDIVYFYIERQMQYQYVIVELQ
jgi:S1-C subfamily serine protease